MADKKDSAGGSKARRDIHNSDVPLVCLSCEARHKGVCGALTPPQLHRLSKHTSKTVHAPGSDLTEDTRNHDRYANILSGVAKLSKMSRDGRQQIVGLQFAPDFLGQPFCNDNDVEVVASTNLRLCSFPIAVLEELMEENPALEHKLYQQTLAELNEARDWLFALGRKTASEKVASFLLLIATHADPERDHHTSFELELPLKRADIADFLGLTIETVSRQITKLRKEGILEVIDRNRVRISDLAHLEAAACTGT